MEPPPGTELQKWFYCLLLLVLLSSCASTELKPIAAASYVQEEDERRIWKQTTNEVERLNKSPYIYNDYELEAYLNRFLEAERFRDYCPNGLQVEGRTEITRIATGVTASLAVVEQAAAAGADALLVHHGYFWRGEDPRLVGPRGRRIAALNAAQLNLFAYHLPLDAHPGIGNNAELARVLGLEIEGWFGEQSVGAFGRFPQKQKS